MTRAALATLALGLVARHAFAQADSETLAGDPVLAPASTQTAPPMPAAPPTSATPPMPAAPPASATPDDLAQAADAAADVALVPAASGGDARKPSSDEIDLSSLGLDPDGAGSFDDKLNLYGFADFNYVAQHWSRDPIFFPRDTRSFVTGNLNVYVAKNLTARARMLAEVRFTFQPNGSANGDGTFVNTGAQDPTNYNRIVYWGGVIIERAYVEYDLTDRLTIRAGHWLTPYGIWNIDHGSPVIAGTQRPFIIGTQLIPEHQTGLDLFGSHELDRFTITGHLTASNGRGPTEAQIDRDTKLAFGGHIGVETPWGLKVGASYYRGRYTGLPATPGGLAETYLEAAYAGDVQFDCGGLRLQAEVIARGTHYADGQRAARPAGFAPDMRDSGMYVLAGYRFDRLWNVMPYFYGEDNTRGEIIETKRVRAGNWGLNFRPTPSLVFKLQYSLATFAEGLGFLAGQTVHIYAAQTSWVF